MLGINNQIDILIDIFFLLMKNFNKVRKVFGSNQQLPHSYAML